MGMGTGEFLAQGCLSHNFTIFFQKHIFSSATLDPIEFVDVWIDCTGLLDSLLSAGCSIFSLIYQIILVLFQGILFCYLGRLSKVGALGGWGLCWLACDSSLQEY